MEQVEGEADSTRIIAGSQVVALARQVVPILRHHADDVDRNARFPAESLQAIREVGLMGLLVPRLYGGLGGGLRDLVDVALELAAGCSSTAIIWAMHCQQVDAIVHFARPELKGALLPRVATDGYYIASVTSEKGKGSDLLTAVAPLFLDGKRIHIKRDAPVVTGGAYADGFLITMRASPDVPPQQVSLIYADRNQLEVCDHAGWDALGMRGTHSVALSLVGDVPDTHIVGAPGGFREVALNSFVPSAHLGWAACWLGAARSALSEFVHLLRSPKRPSGLDLGSPLVAERLGRIRMTLELVSGYLSQVTEEVIALRGSGQTLDDPVVQLHINTLKVAAAELTFEAVDRLIQLGGLSVGYSRSSSIPLERHFRDLRSASLNYANDRLLVANGMLSLLDRQVRLAR